MTGRFVKSYKVLQIKRGSAMDTLISQASNFKDNIMPTPLAMISVLRNFDNKDVRPESNN